MGRPHNDTKLRRCCMTTIESPIPTDPEDLKWFLELLAGLRQRFPDPGQAADLLGQLLERGLDQKDR